MALLYIMYIAASVAKVILCDETKIINYFNSATGAVTDLNQFPLLVVYPADDGTAPRPSCCWLLGSLPPTVISTGLALGDTFKTIQNHWQTERKSFENALVLILQQDFGHGGMNVYVRIMPDSYKISDGFYFSDNVVDLILLEMRLQDLPCMIAPAVTFALASNYLHVEAGLGRMILKTKYLLIRNNSDVVFTASEQDALKRSPFSFQQVQDSGELTIIAQDCNLVGYAISSFIGNTVNMGLNTFKVTNCKFNIEIYSAGLGAPPVFGPYFSEQQSLALETMLSNPIRAELMPKLQAAVFTYVNTSAVFGDKLPQLRFHQNIIFKETSNYMSGLVGKFVQNTIKKTQGILQLNPLKFSWNKTCFEGTCGSSVTINNVILYGLDTAYSAHIGGPFKLQSPKVAEAIRFSTMQVRGKIHFENASVNGEHDFAVEFRDVAVNIEMEAKSSSLALVPSKICVTGWRSFEFSILQMYILGHERRVSQSLIMGYLINEIPKRLLNHISETFGDTNNAKEDQVDEKDTNKADDEPPIEDENLNKNEKQIKANDRETEINSPQSDFSDRDRNTLSAIEQDSHQSHSSDHKEDISSTNEKMASPSDSSDHKHDMSSTNEQMASPSDSLDREHDMSSAREENSRQSDSSDRERAMLSANEHNSHRTDSSERDHEKLSKLQSSMEDERQSVAQSFSHPSDNEVK